MTLAVIVEPYAGLTVTGDGLTLTLTLAVRVNRWLGVNHMSALGLREMARVNHEPNAGKRRE